MRIPARAGLGLWAVACLLCAAGTLSLFWWHIQFFRVAGENFYHLLLAVLPILAAAPFLYHRIRNSGFLRYEPYVLPALVLAPLLLREPAAFFILTAALCGFYGLGTLLLRILRIDAEIPVLRIVAGMGVASLLLLALGSLHLFRPEILAALILLPAVFAWRDLKQIPRRVQDASRNWIEETQGAPVLFSVCLFFLGLFAILGSLSALVPTMNGDAIRWHLALGKIYLQAGSLQPPPFQDYTYYPQGFEVLLTLLWSFGGQAAAQLLNPVQFALCGFLLYALGREAGFPRTGILCGLTLGLTIPFIHWTGTVVKNDMAGALYLLAALLSVVLSYQRDRKCLRAAVFLTGSAFAVKHTALFGALPLAFLVAWSAWSVRGRFLRTIALLLLFAVAFSGWYYRAWKATGNPFFPERISRSVQPSHKAGKTDAFLLRWIKLPWRLHFSGRRDFESPSENPLGFALLALAPLLLIAHNRGKPRVVRILWIFTAVYLLYWSAMVGTLRYSIGAILPLTLLLGDRLDAIASLPGRGFRSLAVGSVLYCALFATVLTVIIEMYPHEPALLTGRTSKAGFLRAELPPFGAAEFLTRNAGPQDLIYAVGDWAVTYMPYPANVNHNYRDDRTYHSPALVELARHPYRFLILPTAPNLSELEDAASQYQKLSLLYTDRNFRVYRLDPK